MKQLNHNRGPVVRPGPLLMAVNRVRSVQVAVVRNR